MNEVVLNYTVVNQQGILVKDLKSADFHVWEDGTPQKIDSFQFQDLPVSMGILVDSSGPCGIEARCRRCCRAGAGEGFGPDDEAFIVNFSNPAYLDQDFTSNISEPLICPATLSTHRNDGNVRCCRRFSRRIVEERETPERSVDHRYGWRG